jgi:hypothetical protein
LDFGKVKKKQMKPLHLILLVIGGTFMVALFTVTWAWLWFEIDFLKSLLITWISTALALFCMVGVAIHFIKRS